MNKSGAFPFSFNLLGASFAYALSVTVYAGIQEVPLVGMVHS
jgi:hypothetical protein